MAAQMQCGIHMVHMNAFTGAINTGGMHSYNKANRSGNMPFAAPGDMILSGAHPIQPRIPPTVSVTPSRISVTGLARPATPLVAWPGLPRESTPGRPKPGRSRLSSKVGLSEAQSDLPITLPTCRQMRRREVVEMRGHEDESWHSTAAVVWSAAHSTNPQSQRDRIQRSSTQQDTAGH